MTEIKSKGSLWEGLKTILFNKNYLLMMLISVCNKFAQSMAKTPTSLYGKSFGMTGAELGAITGTYYLICTLVRPATGPLFDKFNKKLVLIGCFLLKAIGYLVFIFCRNPMMFTIARYIDAVAFCISTTVFMSTASLLVDKKAMGTGLALYGGIPSFLLVGVPIISKYAYDSLGHQSVFIIGIAAMVLGIILIQFLDFSEEKLVKNRRNQEAAEKAKQRMNLKNIINDIFYVPCIPVCMLTFFLAVLLTVNDTFLLVMAEERGIKGAEIFFSIVAATKLFSALIGGISSDIFGVKWMLVLACIGTAVASILLGGATSIIPICIAAALYSISQKGSEPVIKKAASIMAPRNKRGAAMSTNYFIQDIAGVFAGYICSFFFAKLGYTGTYYAVTIFPIIGLVWFLAIYKKSFGKLEGDNKTSQKPSDQGTASEIS